ncbi:hypothetical protein P8631_21245, partial [Guyparkeria sp. 1SP6A2]|nr:hypothetical protein [Guyparkeria sp. 1SP6A2]
MILGHCDGEDCAVEEVLLPNIPPYTRARLLSRQDLRVGRFGEHRPSDAGGEPVREGLCGDLGFAVEVL